jgi:DHA3 family tetracycline resistance protein-like MFS transporter
VRRAALLRPLRERDFALLWTGLSVSMIGDGIYFVAIAWQVYELSNDPKALSIVGFAWMAPQVALLLVGGVLADRYPRRRLLLTADAIRFTALAALAALALSDALALWHVVLLVAVYGCGEALFSPAFNSIVPELVPDEQLVQANALDQVVRPLAFRLIGPAVGGLIVGVAGAGLAFAIDACTFLVSAAALLAMRHRGTTRRAGRGVRRVIGELREGLEFTRSQTWLWATLAAAALALLCFWGPMEVLLPYLVKNELGGGASAYGLVVAGGGLGAITASVALGQRGLPRRLVLAMYLFWALGSGLMALIGVVTASWQAALVYFVMSAGLASGLIIWVTLLQRHVPPELLGRVTSLDWFVSVSLVPLSFLLVAPVSAAIGAEATLVAGGVLAFATTLGFLAVPGVRDVERSQPPAHAPEAPERPPATVGLS